jgi:ubiquinone/menaquinone biosynthesis C-methylase UbiE
MAILKKLGQYFSKHLFELKDTEPELAYNLWAGTYDAQPDNLMLALDEEVFGSLLSDITLYNKIVADVGCGTGRHWGKILDKGPIKLLGFDVSIEMLKILKQKFPQAETHRLISNKLAGLKDEACDCVISTLTIAHIPDAREALTEWNRVLRPGGHVLITDYHPMALAKGGKRTFMHEDHTVAVRNYIHTLQDLAAIARHLGLEMQCLMEKRVDDAAKAYYEKQNALAVFETWKGVPIIYGLSLKKQDAAL